MTDRQNDAPRGKRETTEEAFTAYDRLPLALRRVLMDAPCDMAATVIEAWWSPDDLMRAIIPSCREVYFEAHGFPPLTCYRWPRVRCGRKRASRGSPLLRRAGAVISRGP